MSKKTKISLWVAGALILAGALLFGGVMLNLNWDFEKLSSVQYETNNHTITEPFTAISIETGTADVRILPSTDGTCKLVCHEKETRIHSVQVQEGVLTIRETDSRKLRDHLEVDFSSPSITLYLPQGDYTSLTIRVSTGNVQAESISADTVDITISTGRIRLIDVNCNTLTSKGSTGTMVLDQVIAANTMTIQRSTGNICLYGCDAGALFLTTGTGDIEGSLLTGKEFTVKTNTGDIRIPENAPGGKCSIQTSTGNVHLVIE